MGIVKLGWFADTLHYHTCSDTASSKPRVFPPSQVATRLGGNTRGFDDAVHVSEHVC